MLKPYANYHITYLQILAVHSTAFPYTPHPINTTSILYMLIATAKIIQC
jgi:hypothetical protein